MEFRSQRKLRHRKLKGRKFTFCDFTAFFAGDVLLWSAYALKVCMSILNKNDHQWYHPSTVICND